MGKGFWLGKKNPKHSEQMMGEKNPMFGTHRTEKQKKEASKMMSGKNNPMYGKTYYDIWLEKYGKEEADKRLRYRLQRVRGQKRTKEFRKNLSENRKGENNPMYNRSVYSVWLEKYGKNKADKMCKNKYEKISGENSSSKRPEVRRKMRISRLKQIEEKSGQCIPNYNPKACKLIDDYGKQYGYSFQHAENGGEVCIDSYFPDGIDEKRKAIIEVDEKHHFDTNGNLRPKDIEKQKYLESLEYKIIRIKI